MYIFMHDMHICAPLCLFDISPPPYPTCRITWLTRMQDRGETETQGTPSETQGTPRAVLDTKRILGTTQSLHRLF